jgi:hypothetical protein
MSLEPSSLPEPATCGAQDLCSEVIAQLQSHEFDDRRNLQVAKDGMVGTATFPHRARAHLR